MRGKWWCGLFCLLAGTVLAGAKFGIEPTATEEFPPELVRFRAYDQNPIFQAAPAGQWDEKIRERGWILRDGNEYRMWYTGFDAKGEGLKKLGLATSRDGLVWERSARNPLYGEHWVEDMMVVQHGDKYYMFAEGLDDQAQLLTSSDGIQWHREGQLDVRLANGQPIPPGPYGTPTGWVEDDVWYLLYERSDKGVWLATSHDLKVWTNVQDEPVLVPGPDAYDREMIAVNQVIQYQGRYYAYYHGTGNATKPRTWNTNVAVSTDRIHWKKFSGNPLLEENKSSGIVVPDGDRFRLYTMHDTVQVHLPVE